MTPTNLEVTVMAVLVEEYRNGVLIGSVERDIQLTVINCNNVLPTLSGMDGTNNFSRTVCAGAPLCFTIYSADADALQNTTVTWDTGIPAGTFTTTAGSRPSATFCWTPAAADASATPYCFTATVTDDNCPYFGSQVYSYCITVTQPAVNAGPDQSVCSGTGATLTASGATTYSWNPGGANQAQLVVTPAGTTTYTVTGTNAAGCTATDQVTVNINPLPVAVAGPPQSVCIGASATLQPVEEEAICGIRVELPRLNCRSARPLQQPIQLPLQMQTDVQIQTKRHLLLIRCRLPMGPPQSVCSGMMLHWLPAEV